MIERHLLHGVLEPVQLQVAEHRTGVINQRQDDRLLLKYWPSRALPAVLVLQVVSSGTWPFSF